VNRITRHIPSNVHLYERKGTSPTPEIIPEVTKPRHQPI
jgi:hypothetical protein